MRKSSASLIAFTLLLLASVLGAQQGPAVCERLVEFRDGSILRLSLPADYEFSFRALADDDIADTATPLRLDGLHDLRFSQFPALQQLRVIKDAISELASEQFIEREHALLKIVSGGNGFRPFLQDTLKQITDPESRWRLAAALSALPPQEGIYEHAYDKILTGDGKLHGDIDTWKIDVTYRGSQIELSRKYVRTIRVPPNLAANGNTPIIATTEAIRKDLDVFFPADCMRIDFETDSRGDPLRPGQNLSRRFIPDGVLIETSPPNSFFSVNDFTLNSRSGDQSGATHDPLYQGTVTLTFCVPGNDLDPAGVTHIGLSVGIVQEGGTTIAAFDAAGHRIASLTTQKGGTEFLGLRSDVPIHQLQIIPNDDIDPDVTIDDLVFSVPELLDAGGAQKHLSLDFHGGERLVCASFEFDGDQLVAIPAGGFAKAISMPRESLKQLRTPIESQRIAPEVAHSERFWMLLDDGSTLIANPGGVEENPKSGFKDLPIADLQLTAIWGEQADQAPLPPEQELGDGQIAVVATTKPVLMANPVFTPLQFKATDGDATIEWSYKRLPTIWLKKPAIEASRKATGFIRLNTGERIVLGDETTFKLHSFDTTSVTLTNAEKRIQIPMSDLTTLRLPKK